MPNPLTTEEDRLLYRQVKSIKTGQVERFKIQYTPEDEKQLEPPASLWVKVKNVEMIALRAAYIAGPYVLYVDCRSADYDPNKKCFVTADQPSFEPQLLPGQSFYAELSCHNFKDSYEWTIDVISQIIFNKTIDVDFEITVGTSRKILHEISLPEKKILNSNRAGCFLPNNILNVTNWDTIELWNLPLPDSKKPIHLVILTHGLHSNVTADMLYLKEEIEKGEDNIVVRGFWGNVGKTERGVRYLGARVAEYIIELVASDNLLNDGKVKKISFVGHSLGGLVQTFAIAYVQKNLPNFFENIKPINFITLASPMLGVLNENPLYVKLALSAGIVGKTGQDLGLKYLENDSKPLLLLLPTGPTHQALKLFKRRTVYANVINDGIVPLGTSALLFLDYKGLNQVINSSDNKANIVYNSDDLSPEEQMDTTFSPVQAMISYFLPQKQSKQSNSHYHKYHKYQTKIDEIKERCDMPLDESRFNAPRTSMLETATSLILPPLPSMKYITDPDHRQDVIFHDKLYHQRDIPSENEKLDSQLLDGTSQSVPQRSEISSNSGIKKRLLDTLDYTDLKHVEEKIAREYHKNMTWRKVLVKLKPDAHNNIIVRRRFSNAYGWPVIAHLVKNHFSDVPEKNVLDKQSVQESNLSSFDSLDNDLGLSVILSRDKTIRNKEDDEEKSSEIMRFGDQDTHWIDFKDNSDSLFAVGPTGLLSEASEIVGNLKHQWSNSGFLITSFRDPASPDSSERAYAHQSVPNEDDSSKVPNDDNEIDLAKPYLGGFI